MATGGRGEDTGRIPQFTTSHYEIPSWQIPWNKPWYQRNDKNLKTKVGNLKYNSRGHLIDCSCSDCEEDLDTAFTPQVNATSSLFNIPTDRHEQIDADLLENRNKDGGRNTSTTTTASNPTQSFRQSDRTGGGERVILLSDLPEYTEPTSNVANTDTRARQSNASETRESASFGGAESSPASHESVMESFESLSAIHAISAQAKDIQTRVHDFRGKSSAPDYKVMKGLLESLHRELGRITSSEIEWLQMAKKMAMEAVKKTLETLEQKVKDAES